MDCTNKICVKQIQCYIAVLSKNRMEQKTKEKSDAIEPTQLVRIWSDEYSHEHEVLGTFTSRTALGLFLVGLIEKKTSSSYSDLHDLYLEQIKINPNFEEL